MNRFWKLIVSKVKSDLRSSLNHVKLTVVVSSLDVLRLLAVEIFNVDTDLSDIAHEVDSE